MNPTLKCSCCGRAWCGLTYVNGTPFCDDCINKCVSGRDREMDELKATLDKVSEEKEMFENFCVFSAERWPDAVEQYRQEHGLDKTTHPSQAAMVDWIWQTITKQAKWIADRDREITELKATKDDIILGLESKVERLQISLNASRQDKDRQLAARDQTIAELNRRIGLRVWRKP